MNLAINRTQENPDGTPLRCDCGFAGLFSCAPGHEPEQTIVGRLESAKRMQAWCMACWLKRFGTVENVA